MSKFEATIVVIVLMIAFPALIGLALIVVFTPFSIWFKIFYCLLSAYMIVELVFDFICIFTYRQQNHYQEIEE